MLRSRLQRLNQSVLIADVTTLDWVKDTFSPQMVEWLFSSIAAHIISSKHICSFLNVI